MSKSFSAMQFLATTGTGVVLCSSGESIQLASMHRCSDLAGTLVINAGGAVAFTMSADRGMTWAIPIVITGPVTMTSSAGYKFGIGYRKA